MCTNVTRDLRFVSIASICLVAAAVSRAWGSHIVYDNGAPPDESAAAFPMTQSLQAEDFVLTEASTITAISFYGLERPRVGGYAGSIYWSIRSDDAGRPAAGEISGAVTSSVQQTATGMLRWDYFGAAETIYTFEIPALSLGEGQYWLVLHNGPLSFQGSGSAQAFFLWEGIPTLQGRVGLEDPLPYDGDWQPSGGEHSFFLTGIPEPSSTLASLTAMPFAAAMRIRRQPASARPAGACRRPPARRAAGRSCGR
jgi:hypothetical protein